MLPWSKKDVDHGRRATCARTNLTKRPRAEKHWAWLPEPESRKRWARHAPYRTNPVKLSTGQEIADRG